MLCEALHVSLVGAILLVSTFNHKMYLKTQKLKHLTKGESLVTMKLWGDLLFLNSIFDKFVFE